MTWRDWRAVFALALIGALIPFALVALAVFTATCLGYLGVAIV